ncbi:MAG TPA: tudor domain-containing protein [bacterium]|nr:tudor domain-containing protein [bacterium]HPQ66003.1 tudor domain-containing protein [bacterium]
MKKWTPVLLGAALAVSAAGADEPSGSPDSLEGIYRVQGENYEGTVAIRRKGESYGLTWTIGKAVHRGVGMKTGAFLASSWPGGVVVYEILPGGTLSGRYPGADGALQAETLTFQRPLPVLPPSGPWNPGDSVLADWSQDEYWYPATVGKAEADRYYVVYDDGDEEWTTAERLTFDDIEEGDTVFGNWRGQGVYYPGKISLRRGGEVHIVYDDGDEEDTTVSAVRVVRPRPE